ncbi:MAG TPA: hypothetical protein VF071_00765 [Candidatus Limnocylindria bacterium]
MTEQTPTPVSQPTGERRGGIPGAALLGAILVAVGIIYLIGRVVDLDWGAELWPLYIIGAGVILLALGLMQPGGVGLAVAGGIVGMVGLILFYQEWADHYESWAYAWPLVAPGGSGLGMVLHGARFGDAKVTRGGFWQIVVALGIFAVGFIFFEGVIGLSGNAWGLPEWVLPAAIIGLGLLILVRAFTARDESPISEEPPSGG